jgi:hypothetical protein
VYLDKPARQTRQTKESAKLRVSVVLSSREIQERKKIKDSSYPAISRNPERKKEKKLRKPARKKFSESTGFSGSAKPTP